MVCFWEATPFLQNWSSSPSLAVLQGRLFFVIVTCSAAWSSFRLSPPCVNKSDVHLLIAKSMSYDIAPWTGGGYGLKKAIWCKTSQVWLFFLSYKDKESKICTHWKYVCIAEGARSLRSFRPAYNSVLRYWNLNLLTQDGFRCSGRIIFLHFPSLFPGVAQRLFSFSSPLLRRWASDCTWKQNSNAASSSEGSWRILSEVLWYQHMRFFPKREDLWR